MKKHTIIVIYLLILSFVFLTCSESVPLHKEYVLQVEDVGLRQGVFIRRYQLTGEYGSNNTFTTDMLKKYIANALEPDYILIQHAYDLGMHKEPVMARKIKDYRVNLLADSHPIKYQDINITKNDLREFYDKKSKIYDAEIFQATSYRDADSLFRMLQNGGQLDRPRNVLENSFPRQFHDPSLVYGQGLHPELLSVLVDMQEGEISQPVFAASIWTILKINDITENSTLPSFENMETTLLGQAQALFKYEQQKQFVEELRDTLHVTSRPELYQPIIQAYTRGNGGGAIDLSKIDDAVLQKAILTIGPDKVSVADFAAAFNQAIQFIQLSNIAKEDLDQFAQEYTAQYCLYLDALEKGVDQDEFVQDQLQNKEHRLLLSAYLTDEIMKKISISDRDIKAFYDANPDKWQGDFERIALNVKSELRALKLHERKDALIQKLRKKYTIQYNDSLLQTISGQLAKSRQNI